MGFYVFWLLVILKCLHVVPDIVFGSVRSLSFYLLVNSSVDVLSPFISSKSF